MSVRIPKSEPSARALADAAASLATTVGHEERHPDVRASLAELDAGGAPPGRTVVRLSKQMAGALHVAELTPAQYRALSFLSEDDAAAAASVLASRMSVSRPSITSLVDGLVERGYVERRNAADDRRRVEHVLTSKGRTALARADAAVFERLTVIASYLDDDELARATAGLQAWNAALDRMREALRDEAPR